MSDMSCPICSGAMVSPYASLTADAGDERITQERYDEPWCMTCRVTLTEVLTDDEARRCEASVPPLHGDGATG